MLLDVVLQPLRRRVSGREHDERLHDVAARLVGRGHHRHVGDGGVTDDAVLDFRRTDAIARDLEHVVGAPLVPEVAVGVHCRDVAGAAPVARVLLPRALRVVEVFEEKDRIGGSIRRDAVDRDFAGFAARHEVDRLCPGFRPAVGAGQREGFDAGLHLGIPGFAGGHKEAGSRAAGGQAQAVAAFAATRPS